MLALALAAAMAAAGPFGPQWFGLNVGQPTQAIIDRLGDPLSLDDNEPERGGVTLLYAFDEGRTQVLFTTLYGHSGSSSKRPSCICCVAEPGAVGRFAGSDSENRERSIERGTSGGRIRSNSSGAEQLYGGL